MVWGCFHSCTKGLLLLIPESVTGICYLCLIKRYLPQVIRSVLPLNSSCSFQLDNARVHKPHVVMDWLEKNNIDQEDYSPYSPDFNPVQHVTLELKRRLQQQYTKIADTSGGKETVKKDLARVVALVWETIPEGFFEKL